MKLDVIKSFKYLIPLLGTIFVSANVFAQQLLHGNVRTLSYYDRALRSYVQLYILRVETDFNSLQIKNISVNNGNCGFINQFYLPLSDSEKQVNLKMGQYKDYIVSPGCFPRQVEFDTEAGIETLYFQRR